MEITKEIKSGLRDWIYWKADKAMSRDEEFNFKGVALQGREFSTGEMFGYRRAAGLLYEMPKDATMEDYEEALNKEIALVVKAYTLNNLHKNGNWVTQVQLKGKSTAMMNVVWFVQAIREN